MGKRFKQYKNGLGLTKRLLKKEKRQADKGPCFVEDCRHQGTQTLHCTTCEETGRKKHTIQTCFIHRDEALVKMRMHALAAHPVNLVRAIASVFGSR